MATNFEPSTSPTDTRPPSSAQTKQTPPAFLDLADSSARSNIPDFHAHVELKRREHERQRALHRKVFEDQMRALEQQQQQELMLTIPSLDPNGNGNIQHLAMSAPTTPPRVNAVLNHDDLSPNHRAHFAHGGVDVDVLSKAVGSAVDKRKSVTYAPITHSPEMPSSHAPTNGSTLGSGYARAGAKSMPASRRTSASSHDEDLASHLNGLSLAGERRSPMPSHEMLNQRAQRELDEKYAQPYNAGMMLDEQLDEEMHNAMRNLPTSDERFAGSNFNKLSTSSAALDLAPLSQTPPRGSLGQRQPDSRDAPSEWPQFNGSPNPEGLSSQPSRRLAPNPALHLGLGDLNGKMMGSVSASATPLMPQGLSSHGQMPGSRRGSPPGLTDGLSITTRSVPGTPLTGLPPSTAAHIMKAPGTPLTPDGQSMGGRLGSHLDSPLNGDTLQSSLSRVGSQYDGQMGFNSVSSSYDDPLRQPYGVESVYSMENGLGAGLNGDGYDSYNFSPNRANGDQLGANGTGSTALYHHHGSRYGLGIGSRVGAPDSKMNGLHGPKHKRGEMDREFNRFAGTRLEDLAGEIPSLCKDQHGCRYLQKKLEEGVPDHRDMIFRETFGHFADLMTDPFGNYLCQKLLEYSTDEQRNIICESVATDLVNISLNMHGTRAVQKMIDFLSTRRQTDHRYHGQIHSIIVALSLHVVVLIKDLNGNHVIQKCLNKLAPEDNQFIYNAVAANCVEVATHRHGCCVLQRCIDHASDHQRIQLVNEITYNALTLVQDPYGNYVVQYILDLNDNRFSDAVIRQFTGNVCALSVQKFSSNVIEKCIRVAEHGTRKMLIDELLNRTRLEKLLRDSYGNYCVQTALDYAEPAQRALLVDGIRPVLPLIRNTPYGKRIQNKLQREQMDHFGGFHNQQALVNMALGSQGMAGLPHAAHGAGRHIQPNPLADVYNSQNGLYPMANGGGLQAQGAIGGLHAPLHTMRSHSIDGYVLQGNSSHNQAALANGGFSNGSPFAGVNSFPNAGMAATINDPYSRSSFGYGM
ncbi:ARM repeat-containing protein [Stereum hirsutum FP-91666 SS1]|uniref:ARM repeat-containing protein n=1 Tax=Stereum hirsutum (strain FP-91666) TaxID=721885 RepID=UPI0004449C93|nr:ARM repeat-containing protein [Stereum hirsutum FP-91666 SS1]EIM83313.1 ARM repeat-containing protein [Stereum hirsutum FP-91666 SS1]